MSTNKQTNKQTRVPGMRNKSSDGGTILFVFVCFFFYRQTDKDGGRRRFLADESPDRF